MMQNFIITQQGFLWEVPNWQALSGGVIYNSEVAATFLDHTGIKVLFELFLSAFLEDIPNITK